jgi:hypothetical protein
MSLIRRRKSNLREGGNFASRRISDSDLRRLRLGMGLSDVHWYMFTTLRTNLTGRKRHFPDPISKQWSVVNLL